MIRALFLVLFCVNISYSQFFINSIDFDGPANTSPQAEVTTVSESNGVFTFAYTYSSPVSATETNLFPYMDSVSITGFAVVDSVLTMSVHGVEIPDGSVAIDTLYEWRRSDGTIIQALGQSPDYTALNGDLGETISGRAIVLQSGYNDTSSYSHSIATAIITAPNPVNQTIIVNIARFTTSDYGGDVSQEQSYDINQLITNNPAGCSPCLSNLITAGGDILSGSTVSLTAYNGTADFDPYTGTEQANALPTDIVRDTYARSGVQTRRDPNDDDVDINFAGLDNGTYDVYVWGWEDVTRATVTVTAPAGTDTYDPDLAATNASEADALAAYISGNTVSDGTLSINCTQDGIDAFSIVCVVIIVKTS